MIMTLRCATTTEIICRTATKRIDSIGYHHARYAFMLTVNSLRNLQMAKTIPVKSENTIAALAVATSMKMKYIQPIMAIATVLIAIQNNSRTTNIHNVTYLQMMRAMMFITRTSAAIGIRQLANMIKLASLDNSRLI